MLTVILEDIKKFVIHDIPKPSPPHSGEVQIKVHRIGICGSDISAYYGRHPFINCPIILGHEFSGVISEIGPNVDGLSIGDRCTIVPHIKCGTCQACRLGQYNHCIELKVLGAQLDGAFQQYLNVPAEMTIPVMDSISMEQAALVEPAAVGYHTIQRAHIDSDEITVIFGAGPIGMFAMQSAKATGVKQVISIDKDIDRLMLAEALGVDGTISLSKENVQTGLKRLVGNTEKVDVFIDCVGFSGEALNDIISVARRGIKVIVAGVIESNYKIPQLPNFVEHELTLIGSTMYVPQDFRDVLALMSEEKLRINGMVTHTFNLTDIQSVYQMIDARKEKFFKIILEVK